MKTEIVKQRVLTADAGMYLTNGETYGKTIVLPITADESVWHEITEAEYAVIQAERDAQRDEETEQSEVQ